jgi:hypothetical protein
VFEETSTEFGWALDDKGTTFGVMVAMGIVYHIIGCIVLISHGEASRKSRGRINRTVGKKLVTPIPAVLQQSDAEKWFQGKRGGGPCLQPDHQLSNNSDPSNDVAVFTNLLLHPYQQRVQEPQSSREERELDLI